MAVISEGGNAHVPLTQADEEAEEEYAADVLSLSFEETAPKEPQTQAGGGTDGSDPPAKALEEPAIFGNEQAAGELVVEVEKGEDGAPVEPINIDPPRSPPAPAGPIPPPEDEEVQEGSSKGTSSTSAASTVATSASAPAAVISARDAEIVGEQLASRAEDIPTAPLIASMMTTFRNVPFMSILPAWVCDMTAITMIGTMLPFYVNYVVQPQNPDAVPQCVNDARCNPFSTAQSWDDFVNGCPYDACCRVCVSPAVMFSPSLERVTAEALDAACYVCVGGSVDGNDCVGGTWTLDSEALVSGEESLWCDNTVWMGLGLILLIGGQVISMPFWLQAVNTFGKRPTWLSFNLLNAVTNSLFVFVARGSPMTTILLAFLNGLPMGAQFLTDSILADVIDYDELLTGTRSEGRFTIFQTFIPKIVSIPAQAVPLSLVAALGFISPDSRGRIEEDQPEQVVLFIQLIFFVIPFFLALASFCIKYFFPMRPYHMQKIMQGVALHKQGLSAVDPISRKCIVLPVLTREEVENSHRLDHFWHWQLERYIALEENRRNENESDPEMPAGPVFLVEEMTNAWRLCVALFVGFLSLTIVGCLIGGTDPKTGKPTSMLMDPSLQVIPVMGVICAGLAGVATVANGIRYDVAKSLVINQVTLPFAKLWFATVHGDGTTLATNDDKILGINTVLAETYATHRDVQNKVKSSFFRAKFQSSGRKIQASLRMSRLFGMRSVGGVAPVEDIHADVPEHDPEPHPEPESAPELEAEPTPEADAEAEAEEEAPEAVPASE